MSSLYLIPLILTNIGAINSAKEIFKNKNDVNVALIVHNNNNTTDSVDRSLINSAIWTIQRLNYLEIVPQLEFGLSIYQSYNEKDDYKAIFELFQKHDEEFLIGLVTESKFTPKIQKFTEALDLDVKLTVKYPNYLIKASIYLLSALNWNENITVVAPNHLILEEFSKISRKHWICIKDFLFYDSSIPTRNFTSGNYIIFGRNLQLTTFIQNSDISSAIFIPLDGLILNDLPENNYVIVPPILPHDQTNFVPTPVFFEIATPLVAYAQNLWYFLLENCNETMYKLNCLRNKFRGVPETLLEPQQIINLLKMEDMKLYFNYHIYKSNNNSSLLYYNIFNDNLTGFDSTILDPGNASSTDCKSEVVICQNRCKNFNVKGQLNFILNNGGVRIRAESWVFAFLSISLLGVLFCLAILAFLLISICRRDVLEGNPVLTILLLVATMLMFCSILPLSLEGDRSHKELICLSRSLTITLSFAATFSLILSRSILLATASKEIGFMSHVAGPVQSFLCLFIFGVQAALSLQIIGRCNDIFRGYSFVYLLSYNAMLLLLLLCLCPLIMKSQRNYKEGKYFTIAVGVISCLWCIWVPAYALLGDEWKDSVLCFGLVSTASAMIGTIFVPRTYLMTIAAAKNKITSTLPSLAATSAMDIYRTGTQPVYDCVNVAAINAVTVARAGMTGMQQPDLYSCPHLPADDDDFDIRCDTPVSNDKVTRF